MPIAATIATVAAAPRHRSAARMQRRRSSCASDTHRMRKGTTRGAGRRGGRGPGPRGAAVPRRCARATRPAALLAPRRHHPRPLCRQRRGLALAADRVPRPQPFPCLWSNKRGGPIKTVKVLQRRSAQVFPSSPPRQHTAGRAASDAAVSLIPLRDPLLDPASFLDGHRASDNKQRILDSLDEQAVAREQQQAPQNPSAGVSPDTMRAMMGERGPAEDEEDEEYCTRTAGKKFRAQLASMTRNRWEKVGKAQGGGLGHQKWRRALADGSVQMVMTPPCTPSDQRSIKNLQALLDRRDQEAQEVAARWAAGQQRSQAAGCG